MEQHRQLSHYLLNLDEMSLSEIVQHLNHEDYTTVASMVAYVERISEGKDSRVMADIRELGGVPAVIDLLGHPIPDIHHSAVNILWNMAYRQPNDDGNLAIKNAGGIPALIRLLRSTSDDDVKEIVTGTLWNLSSDEKLKTAILDDGLTVMVKTVIIPESGWPKNQDNDHDIRLRTTPFSVSFTNAAGCLRNISSAGLESRKKMRECEGLVDSCMYALRSVSGSQLHELLDCKAIEHCMCTIQNLSYHIGSEIFQQETTNSHTANIKDNQDFKIGCFSFGKKSSSPRDEIIPMETRNRKEPPRGKDLLWQPEVCRPYLSLLSECSNPDTLEAAAGTVQNLTASDSRWSVDICSDVRKSKGLPMFVELLKIDVDTVVNSVAKAMHNLCQDPRNKELIGKYGMGELVLCLPGGVGKPIQHKSEVVVAIIHCLHRLVVHHIDNARALRNLNGVDKLINISASWGKYSVAEIAAASQVLISLWTFKKLRPVFKKDGWNSQYFHPHQHSQAQARTVINSEDECIKCNTCSSERENIEQDQVSELPQFKRTSMVQRILDSDDNATVMTDTTTTENGIMRETEYMTESVTTENGSASVYMEQLRLLRQENEDYRWQMRHLRKELDRVSFHNVELMQHISKLEDKMKKVEQFQAASMNNHFAHRHKMPPNVPPVLNT